MDALKDKNLLGLYMERLDDEKDIINFCKSSATTWRLCSDDYLKKFLEKRYPGISQYKKFRETWKDFFLRLSYNKGLLLEKYNYKYVGGDFEGQLKLFEYNKGNIDEVFKDAGFYGYLEMISSLLNDDQRRLNRVNVNLVGGHALGLAAVNGHLEAVKLLLKDNRINVSDDNSYALRVAAGKGFTEIVKLLLEDKRLDPSALGKALGDAARNGHPAVVKLLLRDGRVDPSVYDNYALIKAAENGYIEIVKLLLEDGRVDPNARNGAALTLARNQGRSAIVRLLEKYL